MTATIIYCYDAYCGWCYGFSPVIEKIWLAYKEKFSFEVLSGGMILPAKPVHISATAGYIRNAYKKVEEMTGVVFGSDYLWHVNNPEKSDWFPNSEKPAIALSVFKEYFPESQVAFAKALQYALHFEGRDLCDDEVYRGLLKQFAVPAQDFYEKLHDPLYRENTHHEFALVKQLKVSGFPCVFLQITASKFYLLAHGYTPYDTVAARIKTIMIEVPINKD